MKRPLLLPLLVVLCAAPAAPASLVAQAPAPPLDSAVAEIEIGRYWHASRILQDLRRTGGLAPEHLLLLARAEAGYLAWPAVIEILEGAAWLDRTGDGEGWRLLARALGGQERWGESAEAWRRYLSTPHGASAWDRAAARARGARALALSGADGAARAALDSLSRGDELLSSWTALGLARRAAEEGDTAEVRALGPHMRDPEALLRGWELTATARLAARDSAGALDHYRGILEDPSWSLSAGSRARAWSMTGRLLRARGDRAAARGAFLSALDAAPRTGAGVDAAEGLLGMGELDASLALRVARALDAAGRSGSALEAYDRYVSLAGAESVEEDVGLARAKLMANTDRRHDEAVTAFRALSTSGKAEVGAAALEAWARLRRTQGRGGDVETLRGWLLERYPSSPEAVEVVFFRGDAAHDRNEHGEAYRHYARTQEMNPSLSRAGLARMRMGMIELHRDRPREAVAVFRGYLEAFPEGRRWDEATYWAGRTLVELGETAEGRDLLRSIGPREPTSFYAFAAAELLDEPHVLPGLDDTTVPPMPDWLQEGLGRVDLLAAAGLDEGRAAEVDRLTQRAGAVSGDAVLRLAMGLIERDLGLDGINLGWELRREGRPWSRTLLRTVYPYPFRAMIEREAEERGLDPFLVAGLIRQESAFDPDIRSSAGAIGLMQVMPATGEALAKTHGPSGFEPRSLETPEVNLHLGTAYVRDMGQRYGGRLPFILSAYNAGPHRAARWQEFPEAADLLRLTERIPYGETREYVKLVSRNRAIYQALWGEGRRASLF